MTAPAANTRKAPDFRGWFDCSDHADVRLHVRCKAMRGCPAGPDARTYHAHAMFLAAQSEWFNAALSTRQRQQQRQQQQRQQQQAGGSDEPSMGGSEAGEAVGMRKGLPVAILPEEVEKLDLVLRLLYGRSPSPSSNCSCSTSRTASPSNSHGRGRSPHHVHTPNHRPGPSSRLRVNSATSRHLGGGHHGVAVHDLTVRVKPGEVQAMNLLLRLMYSHPLPALTADTAPLLFDCLRLAERFCVPHCVDAILQHITAAAAAGDVTVLNMVSTALSHLAWSPSYRVLFDACHKVVHEAFDRPRGALAEAAEGGEGGKGERGEGRREGKVGGGEEEQWGEGGGKDKGCGGVEGAAEVEGEESVEGGVDRAGEGGQGGDGRGAGEGEQVVAWGEGGLIPFGNEEEEKDPPTASDLGPDEGGRRAGEEPLGEADQALLDASRRFVLAVYSNTLGPLRISQYLRLRFCSLPFAAVLAWAESDELQVQSENCVVYLLSAWVKAAQTEGAQGVSSEQLELLACQVRVLHLGPVYQHHILPQLEWFKGCRCMAHLPTLLAHKGRGGGGRAVFPAPFANLAGEWQGPSRWLAGPRRPCNMPLFDKYFQWQLGEEQLQHLYQGGAVLSPPFYVGGFHLHLLADVTTTGEGGAARTLGLCYFLAPTQVADMVRWSDASAVTVGPTNLHVLRGSVTQTIEGFPAATLFGDTAIGVADMLGRAAPSMRELLAPFLHEGRLVVGAYFDHVDQPEGSEPEGMSDLMDFLVLVSSAGEMQLQGPGMPAASVPSLAERPLVSSRAPSEGRVAVVSSGGALAG